MFADEPLKEDESFTLSGTLGFESSSRSDLGSGADLFQSQNDAGNVSLNARDEVFYAADDGGDYEYAYNGEGDAEGYESAPPRSLIDIFGESSGSPNRKTIRFASDVVFNGVYAPQESMDMSINLMEDSGAISEGSYDLFGDNDRPKSSKSLKEDSTTESDTGSVISSDEESIDSTKEEERRIIGSLLFAGFGVGFVSFPGWAGQKVMNRVQTSKDTDAGGAAENLGAAGQETATSTALDAASDIATEAATEAAVQGAEQAAANAAMNASMTTSSSNMSFGAFPIAPNPGMSGPQ